MDFSVVVVGGGHAGIEAALATSRLGLETLLISGNRKRIGYMSCNPSIGGLAKGHMVRELDVLGGEMGRTADLTCIQFKRLNSRKGPAVRGTRMQSDKDKYAAQMQLVLSQTPKLSLLEAEVQELILNGDVCVGVRLKDGSEIFSQKTILTTGTFLNGVMFIGSKTEEGGRHGDRAAKGLSDQMRALGFKVDRLKTGTPARLFRDSIDWSKTVEQWGDENFFPFSVHSDSKPQLRQIACYLSRTTPETHEIIQKNLSRSPMYCGMIEGTGPRYCPSIEDKIVRFSDRDSHQTFLEPEGLETDLIYLQGISTSLPEEVQLEFLKTIPGLENVRVARYGYAVEYDFFEPLQVTHALESKALKSLFLAGQINGTSGYEEAAVQGFMAGVNAARAVRDEPEFILGRDEAYIGVLIDDLVTKGTKEPYRMFTSRAEHRLILREDNTVDRLAGKSRELGVLPGTVLDHLSELGVQRSQFRSLLKERKMYPNEDLQKRVEELGSNRLLKSISFEEFLRRPEVGAQVLTKLGFEVPSDPRVYEPVEIEVKYSGYVSRQMELLDQWKKNEALSLDGVRFSDVRGLSNEEIEKLNRIGPRTLGQASRISGVNPSAIQSILVFIKASRNTRHTAHEHISASRQ